MCEGVEYRVNGMYQNGYYTAADTEWMSAEQLAKVLSADLVTTRTIHAFDIIERRDVVLNNVTHVHIQKRERWRMPKLFKVEINHVYYALAESKDEAEGYWRDACTDVMYDIADAEEVGEREFPEWGGKDLVYGGDEDTTLDEARVMVGLPTVEETKRVKYGIK
jgi:hypothetical protein